LWAKPRPGHGKASMPTGHWAHLVCNMHSSVASRTLGKHPVRKHPPHAVAPPRAAWEPARKRRTQLLGQWPQAHKCTQQHRLRAREPVMGPGPNSRA
jgi:hypothetical protein